MSHRPPATSQLDLKTSEEAALWLHRLEHEDSAETRAAFAAWVRNGARNLEEFLFAQAVVQVAQLQVEDAAERVVRERAEGDDFIEPIDKFRAEELAEVRGVIRLAFRTHEAERGTGAFFRANITGHN